MRYHLDPQMRELIVQSVGFIKNTGERNLELNAL